MAVRRIRSRNVVVKPKDENDSRPYTTEERKWIDLLARGAHDLRYSIHAQECRGLITQPGSEGLVGLAQRGDVFLFGKSKKWCYVALTSPEKIFQSKAYRLTT